MFRIFVVSVYLGVPRKGCDHYDNIYFWKIILMCNLVKQVTFRSKKQLYCYMC